MADRIRVALAGPPFSGKTTVGRLLAAELGIRFIDLDGKVEEEAGMTIPRIFARMGEEGFRALESRVLEASLKTQELVLALGGGALLDAGNLRLVCGGMRVFTLWASRQELVSRSAEGGRPLARSADGLARLLRRRRSHYLSLPERLDTTGLSARQVTELLAERISPTR